MPILMTPRPRVLINGLTQARVDSQLLAFVVTEQADGLNTLRLQLNNWVQDDNGPGYAFGDGSWLKFGDGVAIGFGVGAIFQEVFHGPASAFEAEFSGAMPTFTVLAQRKQRLFRVSRRKPIQLPSTITLRLGAELYSAKALGDLAGPVNEVSGTAEGNPLLHRGVWLTLAGLGVRFSGTYQVTHCCHRFEPQLGYRTDFVAKPVVAG